MKKNLESYPLILFIFLSLLTALSYVMHELQWRSSFNPSVHIPGALLLVFHIGMHLRVVQIRNQRHGILLYLLIQAAVVAAVACISLNAGLLVLLTVWLCGEEVGVSSDLIQALRNVGFYILGFLFLIFLLYDTVSALTWIGAALPTVVFALIAIFLYSSERKAREQAQLLANELREANIQLSDYSSQIAELTRQNERRRFARDLHDTLAQGLLEQLSSWKQ